MHIVTQLYNDKYFTWHTAVSVLIGMAIGAITSYIVNATLIEISLNSFFSLVTHICSEMLTLSTMEFFLLLLEALSYTEFKRVS